MSNDVEKGKAGQFFEDFLKEQGTLEESNEVAIKRVFAFQPDGEMKQQCISKAETARRLDAGRSQMDWLPDPEQ